MIRNPNCAACRMHVGSSKVCNMVEDIHHKPIMVVGYYPSFDDSITGAVMGDPILDGILKKVVNIDPSMVHRAYLVKCRGMGVDFPGPMELDTCSAYIHAEIEAVKPKVIIALGEDVSRYFTGVEGISAARGEVYERNGWINQQGEFEIVKVIPTYATSYTKHNTFALKDIATDILKGYHIAIDYKIQQSSTGYKVVKTVAEFDTLMEYVQKVGRASFDFESSGLNYWAPEFFITGMAISFNPGYGYFIPMFHKEPIFDSKGKFQAYQAKHFTDPELAYMIERMETLFFANRSIRKIAHNLKFDLHCARTLGIHKFHGRYDDTMVMHSLLEGGLPHDLKSVGTNYFRDYYGYEAEVKKHGFDKVPLDVLGLYACTDTDLTLRLGTILENALLEDERSYVLYRNLSMPLLFSLEAAEWGGALIDKDLAEKYINEAQLLVNQQEEKLRSYKQVKRFEQIEREAAKEKALIELQRKLDAANLKSANDTQTKRTLTGQLQDLKAGRMDMYEKINFGSTKVQLPALLYGPNGFRFKPPLDNKGAVTFSTGKDVLINVSDNTGFLDDLKKWRSLAKLLSTYLKPIYDNADINGYIHTSFNQHTVITGRLSSSDPINFQNIPDSNKVKDPETKIISSYVKSMFGVPEGHTFVAIDFSQAELRVIAQFSNDANMLKVFADNKDIHTVTGYRSSKLTEEAYFALPPEEQKSIRTKAKPVNFGYVYGQQAEGFIEYAKLTYGVIFTLEEAKALRNGYFLTYPKLIDYHNICKAKAHKFKFVRTLFGRKVHIREIDSFVPKFKAEAERTAINAPIQGTSGEWCCFSMAMLQHRLDKSVKLVNNVHDALYYYVPNEILERSLMLIKSTCEDLPTVKYFKQGMPDVRMKIDAEKSMTGWKDLEKLEIKI